MQRLLDRLEIPGRLGGIRFWYWRLQLCQPYLADLIHLHQLKIWCSNILQSKINLWKKQYVFFHKKVLGRMERHVDRVHTILLMHLQHISFKISIWTLSLIGKSYKTFKKSSLIGFYEIVDVIDLTNFFHFHFFLA